MTEAEMKLALLRYNTLSKERAEASYKWRLTGIRDSKWSEYEDKMTKMMEELHEYGYDLVYDDYKTEGEVRYSVYKLVPISNA